MKDMKKAMELGLYKRVVEVKDILAGYSHKDINLNNIVDYVVLNACTIEYYTNEDIQILEITQNGIVRTSDGSEKFYIDDFQYYLPSTKFCMQILKCYFRITSDFSKDVWEDIKYYGLSKSCATMLDNLSILK